MNKILLCLSIVALFSFAGKPGHPFKDISKVRQGLFMDRAEVTNIAYREYLYWLEKNESKGEYNAAKPKLLEMFKAQYGEPIWPIYFEHAAYNDYPVVGVSYNQAVNYCNWRSNRVNELIAIKKLNKKGKRFNNKVVVYRLPTKLEWEQMAKDALDNNNLSNKILLKKHNLASVKPNGEIEKGDLTSPVFSFKTTGDKMYNLIGNVAEMVQEKGIAKGGSYQHILQDIAVKKDFKYTKPESWLGFRCVMEVVEK